VPLALPAKSISFILCGVRAFVFQLLIQPGTWNDGHTESTEIENAKFGTLSRGHGID